MKSEDENRDSLHCFIVTFDLLFFPNTFCVSMYYLLNQYICFYLSNNKVVLQSESFLKLWVIFCCIQLLIFKVYRRANGCCHVTAYASRWHVNNRNWCVFSLPWMQLYADRIDFYASGLHNMGCCFFFFVSCFFALFFLIIHIAKKHLKLQLPSLWGCWHSVFLTHLKNASVCNGQCWAIRQAGHWHKIFNVAIFLHLKCDKSQTLHDGTTYWSLPVHTTFSDWPYFKVIATSNGLNWNFMCLSDQVKTL